MFDNLVVVAVIVLVLWLVSLGLYLYASRQQQEIQQELQTLRKQLDAKEKVNSNQ